MTSLKSFIITLFVLIYSVVVFSQQNELEFYITFTECPNGVGSSNNITTTIGECTLIENCGTYKSIKTVEKFTNNYESRVFNNNNCKGVFSKKTIWFECVPGGVSAEGSVVYCSQYGIDKYLQFSSSTTTSKQTTTITTSGPSSTVVSSSGNSFSSASSSSSSSGGFNTGFLSGITGGGDKNLQISSTPSTTSSTTTSKQTTTITTSGPSSTVVSSSGNSFSISSSSSSGFTGFPSSITSKITGGGNFPFGTGGNKNQIKLN
ncbi:hypothetical protein ACTFIY_005171 [Dictyostelium cf. discoideum]